MTFDKNKIHFVPPMVQDRAAGMLYAQNTIEARETLASQIEAVRDYCIEALQKFEAVKKDIRPHKK